MNSYPKISIILPVYNGEKYIGQAINSILRQNYANWELIVINDCSTDRTLEIVNNFMKKDARICAYSNKTNLKLPKTLNIGFEKATGEYFTWTSDDNCLKPEMLQVMAEILNTNPDIGMVYSNYSKIDADGRLIDNIVAGEPHDLLYGNPCGPSFLYRRSVIDKVGIYDSGLFLAEDYDYWMRIYYEVPIMHIPNNLYLYRQHDESLSGTKRDKVISQSYRAIKKNYINLLSKTKNKDEIYRLYDNLFWLANKDEKKCLHKILYVSRIGHKLYHIKKKIIRKLLNLEI